MASVSGTLAKDRDSGGPGKSRPTTSRDSWVSAGDGDKRQLHVVEAMDY